MKKMSQCYKSSIAAISGNFIEWYDFALFLFLAPVIAKQYFTDAGSLALLGTFTVHAISFFFRPLGAILFGHIGDVYGRVIALRISLSVLAGLSMVIAVLPSYQSVGYLATLLLCLCRIGQGICLGGEFAGSMIYIAETMQPEKRSFFTSFSNNASNIGILAAAGSATLLSQWMSQEAFFTYGYRILFFIGGSIGVLGFAFRKDLKETTTFIKAKTRLKVPILFVFKNHYLTCIQLFLILNITALGSYAFIGYMSTFLHQTISLNMTSALRYETLFIVCTLFIVPYLALRADILSPRAMLKRACLTYIIVTIPCYYLFFTYQQPLYLLPVVIAYSMEQSCVPALIMDYFPVQLRYSGVSFIYNTCMAMIGGLSPLLGQLLVKTWKLNYGIGYLLIVSAAVTLLVLKKQEKNVLSAEITQEKTA